MRLHRTGSMMDMLIYDDITLQDPDSVVFRCHHGSGNAHIYFTLSFTYDSSQFPALPYTFWLSLGFAPSSNVSPRFFKLLSALG
jgi:hypothetical protein